MHWMDWAIGLLPLIGIFWISRWAKRYTKSVSDYLTGGRVAGRYLLTVSGMEASQGIFGSLALYEAYYQSGFAYSFWEALSAPVIIVMALTGYATYRYRETRAMTMGQFLEIRYSRSFRIFAGILQSTSGVLNYGLFPAVGGRFFVYFCGLPTEIDMLGFAVPTFAIVMAIYLTVAASVAIGGGQLTIMVADCVVGILTYPMYLVIIAYIVWRFSWLHDLAPALLNRPAGHSLINPFDIAELRDFNLFYVLVGIFGSVINRLSWSGNQGFFSAGRTPHEQKMAGVLATWRVGFSMMMYVLVPVVALAYFNVNKFNAGPHGADAARIQLATQAIGDALPGIANADKRGEFADFLKTGNASPALEKLITSSRPTAPLDKPTTPPALPSANAVAPQIPPPAAPVPAEPPPAGDRVKLAHDALRQIDPAAAQTFTTLSRQMSVPMALRYILPIGVLGMFVAICVSLLMATDASYQHSWGSVIVQDVILPLRNRPLSPAAHLRLLRCMVVFVASFAFCFSYAFGQVDYILMFAAITGAIWLGGSGPVIIGGLYWKRGTTAAAWCTLIGGSSLAISSFLAQKYWVGSLYPWLNAQGWIPALTTFLETASWPFEPIIKWRMTADKFPINSQELFFITMMVSVGLYVGVTLLTSRTPFNMDRMLHRGIYRRPDEAPVVHVPLTVRNALTKLLGIDEQYTRGDRLLAWSVFIWSFGWKFGVGFVLVSAWNVISPWGDRGWTNWFYLNNFIIAGLIGIVSTVWFTIGGTRDLVRLFKDLPGHRRSAADDGSVVGHVSKDDLETVPAKSQDGAGTA